MSTSPAPTVPPTTSPAPTIPPTVTPQLEEKAENEVRTTASGNASLGKWLWNYSYDSSKEYPILRETGWTEERDGKEVRFVKQQYYRRESLFAPAFSFYGVCMAGLATYLGAEYMRYRAKTIRIGATGIAKQN